MNQKGVTNIFRQPGGRNKIKNIYLTLDEDPIAGSDEDGVDGDESEDDSEDRAQKYGNARNYPDDRYHEKTYERRRDSHRVRNGIRNGHYPDQRDLGRHSARDVDTRGANVNPLDVTVSVSFRVYMKIFDDD